MTINTFGSNATSTLRALQWNPQSAIADIASIAANIKDDINPAHPISPGAFSSGKLFIPNRGLLLLKPGDWVVYDPATGWPMLVSAGSKTASFTSA